MAMDPVLEDLMRYVRSVPEEQLTPDKALAISLASGGSKQRQIQPNGVEMFKVGPGETFENQAGSFSRSEKPIATYGPQLAQALAGQGGFNPALRLKQLEAQGTPTDLATDVVKAEHSEYLKQQEAQLDNTQKGQAWLDIANTAEGAVNRAGVTGRYLNDAASWLQGQGLLPDTQGQPEKRAATAELDALFPQALKLLKIKGDQMTDADRKALMQALPSSDKTPEENAALIKAIREQWGGGMPSQPQQRGSGGGGLPSVGESFGGGKVLKVTKIG